MKTSLIFILLISFWCISFAQSIKIGTQVWMTKNLDVSTFRNGDPIPQVKSEEAWDKAGDNKQPAWCYYNNEPANATKHGKIYNGFAVYDPRGLAPKGWHIPSINEWEILINYLGGENSAGGKMKSTSGWKDYGNGTNTCGFKGLPGGSRESWGSFKHIGYWGNWWTSTEASPGGNVYIIHLFYENENATFLSKWKKDGNYIRCIKD